MSWEVRLPEQATIRFEVQNSKPVDLFDLTSALSAFGEGYQDHIIQSGIDLDRDHLRLYVKELKTGSIIADLVSLAPQISAIVEHIDLATGFITHLSHVALFSFCQKRRRICHLQRRKTLNGACKLWSQLQRTEPHN
jgi:hypothetical protein